MPTNILAFKSCNFIAKSFLCKTTKFHLLYVRINAWKKLLMPHAISTFSLLLWERTRERMRIHVHEKIIWFRVHFPHHIPYIEYASAWKRWKCNEIDYIFNFNTFEMLHRIFLAWIFFLTFRIHSFAGLYSHNFDVWKSLSLTHIYAEKGKENELQNKMPTGSWSKEQKM